MIRIMHVLNTNSFSGAENVVLQIIENYSEQCEGAYVSFDGPIRSIVEEHNIAFYPITKLSTSEIRRIVKLYHPDIIHAHDFRASLTCALAFTGVPTISHLHNNSPWLSSIHPYSVIYLIGSLGFKRIFMVSESILKEYVFKKMICHKSKIVSNPFDAKLVQSKALLVDQRNQKYDMIFLGRLSIAKNVPRFINLVDKLSVQHPELHVAIAGDGELRNDIILLIQQKKLESIIDYLGFLENPYPVLSKARLLCITSIWEGFGMVAAEALALGVPVVATSVGGLSDIITEKCGKLCDTDEDFISEIELLLNNDQYYKEKASRALARSVELCNIEKYIQELEKEYKSLLS